VAVRAAEVPGQIFTELTVTPKAAAGWVIEPLAMAVQPGIPAEETVTV
jgi:hypothetical protein